MIHPRLDFRGRIRYSLHREKGSMNFQFKTDGSSGLPIYRQLRNELKRYIAEHELHDGDMLPSVSELAAAAHVCVRTMDRALRELVRDGICHRRPKKGTFVGVPPREDAEEKKLVILYVPSFGMEYFRTDQAEQMLYSGMRQEAARAGVELMLVHKNLEFYLERLDASVRGVLLFNSVPLSDINPIAGRWPWKRFVYVNYFMPGFAMAAANIYGVFNDDFGGAFEIASWFFGRGCRNPRVLYFNTPDINYEQRLQGVLFAARRNGVSVDGRLLALKPGHSLAEMLKIAREAAARLLEEDPGIDIFITTCDYIGYGVRQHLLAKEITGVRIAGYDGYRLSGRLPDFPTMQIDFPAIGAEALHIAAAVRQNSKVTKVFPNFLNRTPGTEKLSGFSTPMEDAEPEA